MLQETIKTGSIDSLLADISYSMLLSEWEKDIETLTNLMKSNLPPDIKREHIITRFQLIGKILSKYEKITPFQHDIVPIEKLLLCSFNEAVCAVNIIAYDRQSNRIPTKKLINNPTMYGLSITYDEVYTDEVIKYPVEQICFIDRNLNETVTFALRREITDHKAIISYYYSSNKSA